MIARLGAGPEAMDGADPWHDVWGDRYSERAQRMRAVRTALRAFVSLACSSPVSAALAQQADSTPVRTEIAGAVTVTTKGISTIPTFTLGKPAAIVDLSIRRDRMSLEPQFRYGLDGKPWTFLFWGRYRLLEGDRLRMTIGGHPAISFRATSDSIGGVQREVIVARRCLAGELAPTYALSRHATVGLYWLYSYAVESDVTKHTHYLAARSVHTIPLSDGFALRLAPQTYYLKLDALDGLYANGTLMLGRRRLPFSLSTSATTKIRSDIAGDSFIWNVSLTYTIE